MSSFLEKLKKGTKTSDKIKPEETENTPKEEESDTLAEDDREEEEESDPEETRTETTSNEDGIDEEMTVKSLVKPKKPLTKKTKPLEKKLGNLEIKSIPAIEEKTAKINEPQDKEWLETEGQLGVDMYQTENELVVQSAIAGIKTEDLDVLIEDDVLTIKGKRNNPYRIDSADYFIQECYWGAFSRRIILPVEVDASKTDAQMRDGILTIRIPKLQRESKKRIVIKG